MILRCLVWVFLRSFKPPLIPPRGKIGFYGTCGGLINFVIFEEYRLRTKLVLSGNISL